MRTVALVLACLLAACDDGSPRPADAAVAAPDAPVTVDAAVAVADAGPDAGPSDAAPEFGVRCGASQDLCVPASSQGCCTFDDAGVGCEPINGLCLGRLQSCDGPEDCKTNPGELCCDFGFGPGCGAINDCIPKQGGTVQCHFDENCPPTQPICCSGACATGCR